MSVVPAGGPGTTRRTGRLGYAGSFVMAPPGAGAAITVPQHRKMRIIRREFQIQFPLSLVITRNADNRASPMILQAPLTTLCSASP